MTKKVLCFITLINILVVNIHSDEFVNRISSFIEECREFEEELQDPSDVYNYYYIRGQIRAYEECLIEYIKIYY